ncbi:beta-glucosidase BglX [Ascidiimonas sp. W6]|uniref:beta-glucosidase BglX n=1 Tax=Ascidiimonas meishanensis TaxID=3128903 RepID=UPI0030EEB752
MSYFTKCATLLICSLLLFNSCSEKNKKAMSNISGNDEIEKKVDSVLKLMTLPEKIGQMNQYNGFWDVTGPAPKEGDAEKKYEDLRNGLVGSMLNVRGVEQVRAIQKIAVEETRLGIPLIIGFDAIHGYKTLSPIPLAEAASWDLEAIRKSAEVSAAETAAVGINWTFAPMVDISRDPRWGRVMEGAGEDPFLGSRIAEARIKGFQGEDLSDPFTIAACAKHFAAYGFVEGGLDYNTVDIGTSTLYNVVLPPFKAAADAGVKTFMNAFNVLNAIPATGNKFLQRDILKEDWSYDGFVVSDWESIEEMIWHGYAEDAKEAAYIAASAGSDMDMESALYLDNLEVLIKEGKIKESLIDDAVRRILRVKFELGLFDDPYRYCNTQREKETLGKKEHHEAVLDMALKSIVLLKNENNLLPIKKEGQKIALIGALANDKNSPLGSWRLAADDNTAISVLEGMNEYNGNSMSFEKGPNLIKGKPSFVLETEINTTDRTGFEAAVNAAKNSDVAVLVLGEYGYQSGEARSRVSLELPGMQQELLEAVYEVNKNVVLVLMNGRPLILNWADKNIPAIVETWQLGTQSGHAIAKVLYGDYNPSGKLPMSFPRSVGQIPIYYNHRSTGRPEQDEDLVFWTHYGDVENSPLYPFGYGLSYTTFEYKNLESDAMNFKGDKSITFQVEVSNTGAIAGKEVVQWYLQDIAGSATRPVRELKGFELVTLEAGQSKVVSFTINKETITYYSGNNQWEAEPGTFKVYVGGNSNASLKQEFNYIK